MHVNELQIEKHVKHILEKRKKKRYEYIFANFQIDYYTRIGSLPRPLNMGAVPSIGVGMQMRKVNEI